MHTSDYLRLLALTTCAAYTLGQVPLISAQTEIGPLRLGGATNSASRFSLVTDIGAVERIDAADQLRTLSLALSSAACHLHAGVASVQSRRQMNDARVRIGRILDGLEHGSRAMHIVGRETRRQTLAQIHAARGLWAAMQTPVSALSRDPTAQDALTQITQASDAMLQISFVLLSELSGQYTNPVEVLQVDALMIDIAGRQSMLTQLIAREVCEVWAGQRTDARLAALSVSMDLFPMGISALRDGLPDLGLRPAPTPDITRALTDILADWSETHAGLAAVLDGETDPAQQAELYDRLNRKTLKLGQIVQLYAGYAKQRY